MKEVVVISGKGGTGKTSVTASLALLAGRDAVLADCDVDAADLHLLLRPDFAHAEPFVSGEVAVVDPARCRGCGRCLEVCRFEAVSRTDGRTIIDPTSCEGCGYCARVCPEQAITNQRQTVGQWYRSRCRTGASMVHARLAIGADNSGKLVARVKQEAHRLAEVGGHPLLLVDGAPGVGCPVVSSLSGADLVLLVTEPTVSGRHDLQRVRQLIDTFGLPSACILNKADLSLAGRDALLGDLTAGGVPLLAEIPYRDSVPAALAAGKTILEHDPELATIIERAWDGLQGLLQAVGRTS